MEVVMVDEATGGVPEQAQAVKDEAMSQATDLKDTALEHVGGLAQEAKTKAGDVVGDMRRELETQGDAQAKRAAAVLHDVGSQLHDMAAAGQPGPVADVTRQLADKSRQVASRIEEGGVQAVGDDLRQFARRQPGLFLAAAGVAGFVVTRVLRNAHTASTTGLPSMQSPPPRARVPNGMASGAQPPSGTFQ
jgi:hypothetical protein